VRVTIKKIAEELGINHSTVSRVLNDKQSNLVSQATRDRIMQTALRMGYRPSRIAQALQGKSTHLIGVFLPDDEDSFLSGVVRSLRRTVECAHYELMVFPSSSDGIARNWQRLLQWDLDGIFVFDYMFYVDGLAEALMQHTGHVPPIVGLFSHHTQLQDFVTVDFAAALEGLLEHLRLQDCRRLGYMALPLSFTPAEQRYAVFSNFVARYGLEKIDFRMQEGGMLMESARQCMVRYLETGQPLPDALFCQNDEIALGAYRALCEAGVRIPDDVALAGCDDVPYMAFLETPLTTISLPIEDVCQHAWRILQGRMEDPSCPPSSIMLAATLQLRTSCRKQVSSNHRDDATRVATIS
jgi:LacI family transcriptional regulator